MAAEYWGVTLDVVWRRIYNGLIPHKSDGGFIFVDVDPWSVDAEGKMYHEPPATFVTPEELDAIEALEAPVVSHFQSEEPGESSWEAEELPDEDDGAEESALPELDEDESATFGRLSWTEVRRQVSRTRKPPTVIR